MNEPAVAGFAIPAMSQESIDKVRALEAIAAEVPQLPCETQHLIHAGMYARTMVLPAGYMLTGVLLNKATILIVSGSVDVFVGDRTVRLDGYHVLAASAGRKQAFVAHADTALTMLLPTDLTTVEEIEESYTDEAYNLASRKAPAINQIINTGGDLCHQLP